MACKSFLFIFVLLSTPSSAYQNSWLPVIQTALTELGRLLERSAQIDGRDGRQVTMLYLTIGIMYQLEHRPTQAALFVSWGVHGTCDKILAEYGSNLMSHWGHGDIWPL